MSIRPACTPSETQLRRFLPGALAQSDDYVWRALGASVKGDDAAAGHFARLSRMTCSIARRVYQLENGEDFLGVRS